MRSRPLVILLAALAGSLAPAAARAEAPDAEVAARLSFIEARLDAGTPAAQRWWYGSFVGFGVLSVAQYGIALGTRDIGFRSDTAVGAVSSSLGVVGMSLAPFPALFAAAELRALPEGTPEARRRKLLRAESLLRRSAEAEVRRSGWLAHVTGAVVSLGAGAVLALAYHRIRSGIINGVVGVGVSELQIFLLPRAAIADLDAYRKGTWSSPAPPRGPTVGLVPAPGGLGLAVGF